MNKTEATKNVLDELGLDCSYQEFKKRMKLKYNIKEVADSLFYR